MVQKDLKIGHIRHVFGIVNTPFRTFGIRLTSGFKGVICGHGELPGG